MESLVTVDWLQAHFEDKNLVILDATMPTVAKKDIIDGNNGSIPGARFFDLKNVFKNKESKFPNTVPTVDTFEEEVSRLGISKDSTIVIYDRYGIHTSPRAWYLFTLMGHSNVSVLNGGLPAWQKAGNPVVEKEDSFLPASTKYITEPLIDAVRSFEFVDQHNANSEYLILDARSSGRFTGESPEPRKELQSGCIPNSINIPYGELIQDGHMKSKKELIDIFGNAVTKSDQHIITSCGSGLTACILLLALDQIGISNKSLFDGSWTEWATRKELLT